ncbi:MAG: type II toxin-antitoxin system RelE/ParE family toxin [Deltaproteobacteria bacterium]|nr:type II toxin-antitoxin system RelE/ParE family toxin [Deltaproteobacteria bacterium]
MAQPPVDIHPEAVAEAQAAYRWYHERNQIAAAAFLAELDRAVELISEGPMHWPAHLHGTRRFLLRRFPFAIVYREVGETIQIVAVAHGRRKPGYWKAR